MEEIEKITKAAGTVGLATLLSRVLGFVRDAVIAGLLGAGMSSDAFFVAFRMFVSSSFCVTKLNASSGHHSIHWGSSSQRSQINTVSFSGCKERTIYFSPPGIY